MPLPPYPTWENLAVFFEDLMREYNLSGTDAVVFIVGDYWAGLIELRYVSRDILPSLVNTMVEGKRRVGGRDRLRVETADGMILDADKVEVRRCPSNLPLRLEADLDLAARAEAAFGGEPKEPEPVEPKAPAAPMTYAQRRAAKRAETLAAAAAKKKKEADTLQKLRDEIAKGERAEVTGRKDCEYICRNEFGIGPQGARRIWQALQDEESPRSELRPRKRAHKRIRKR